jgi:hypothetical protein
MTANENEPFIVDVHPVLLNELVVHITINNMHLNDALNHTHHQYHIRFNKEIYQDINKPDATDHPNCQFCFNQLKFIIPMHDDYNKIGFTLFDEKFNLSYNLIGCVDHPRKKYPLGVCAYASDFNSDDELFTWLSFQKIQNVSKVMLYAGTMMEHYESILHKEIRRGFVILHDFTWSRNKGFGGRVQRNHQQAQMNACVYRYKYYFHSILLFDLDEYVYSMQFPYDLPAAASYLHALYPQASVIQVELGFCTK